MINTDVETKAGSNKAEQPGRNMNGLSKLGYWDSGDSDAEKRSIAEMLLQVNRHFWVVSSLSGNGAESAVTGEFKKSSSKNGLPVMAFVPSCPLENLGDPEFLQRHGLKLSWVGGSMAHGISSCEMVEALSLSGMLGFFGAAGLPLSRVEAAIDRLSKSLEGKPWGANLIHSPNEPALEEAIVDLYIRKNVRLIEASAFLDVTPPLVRYRTSGLRQGPNGEIITPNKIIAKVSRVEVAQKFFSPPPKEILAVLVASGAITEQEATLAGQIPLACDLTAEADSGGHTDNRPLVSLLPTMLALRDRMQAAHGYKDRLFVGAAGGIATPSSAAAAFSMGAAYVVGGSIHQACIESGTSPAVQEMLAQVEQADVIMAPAADMFEMGVKVQVIKRGTMFAMRSAKLYDIYRAYERFEDVPAAERSSIEKAYFRSSFDDVWNRTCQYFQERDVTQVHRANQDPKHKMALVFRWYLSQASHWAVQGDATRRIDYQVWCGPSMGAFNEWAKGTFLENPQNRKVVTVAMNGLYGAAILMRQSALKMQGFSHLVRQDPRPIEIDKLKDYLL